MSMQRHDFSGVMMDGVLMDCFTEETLVKRSIVSRTFGAKTEPLYVDSTAEVIKSMAR